MSTVFTIGRQSTSAMTMTASKSTGCCTCTKKKLLIIFITLCMFTILFYVLREKYFFRADVLVAISSRVDNTNVEYGNDVKKEANKIDEIKKEENNEGGVLSFFGFGNNKKKKNVANVAGDEGAGKLNVWDAWMKQNKHFTSIGDIYDKCGKNAKIV